MRSYRKVGKVLLAAALVFSTYTSAFAVSATGADAEAQYKPSQALLDTLVKREASANKRQAEKQGEYRPEDEVRVIVELSSSTALQSLQAKGKTLSSASSAEVSKIRSAMIAAQNQVLTKVSQAKIAFSKRASYTNVLNGFGGDVKYKDIAKLKKTSGVKNVYIANRYEPLRANSLDAIHAIGNQINSTDLKGDGMVIAIVDSGIDYRHPEFGNGTDPNTEKPRGTADLTDGNISDGISGGYTSKVIGGYNHADKNNDVIDRNTHPAVSNHGTHVAGIAAGKGLISDPSVGQGVAPNAYLLAEKVFSNDPDQAWAYSDDIISGIDHAVLNKADVINLSLGAAFGYVDSTDPEMLAVQRAVDAGVVVVAAAGNEGNMVFADEPGWTDYATLGSPATWPSALSVAASNVTNDGIAGFSSWGMTPELLLKPNLSAPGDAITSTVGYPNYEELDGTSMATPHVAGAAALVKQAFKLNGYTASVAHIQAALANTSEILTEADGDPILPLAQGSGLVQIDKAVKTPVIVTSIDGLTAISLKEISTSVFDFAVKVRNLSNQSQTYSIGNNGLFISELDSLTEEVKSTAVEGESIISSLSEITIPGGGEATFVVTVSLPSGLPQDRYLAGWVQLTSGSLPALVIPYAGYYGDWEKVSLFNEQATFIEDEDNELNDDYPTGLYTEDGFSDYWLGATYDKDLDSAVYVEAVAGISPNGDGIADFVLSQFSLLRNTKQLVIELLSSDRQVIRTLMDSDDFRRDPYTHGAFWDGTVFNSTTNDYEVVQEGQYYIQIKGLPVTGNESVPEDWQKLTLPVKVDLTGPAVTASAALQDNKIALTVESSDAGTGVRGYDVYAGDEFVDFFFEGDPIVIPNSVWNGSTITVVAYDYALNYSTVELDSDDIQTDFIYTGETMIEAPTGELELSWWQSEQVAEVRVYSSFFDFNMDELLTFTAADAGDQTYPLLLEEGNGEIVLTAYNSDGDELAERAIVVDVDALSNVEVCLYKDGACQPDEYFNMGDTAQVNFSIHPDALSKVTKAIVSVTDGSDPVMAEVVLTDNLQEPVLIPNLPLVASEIQVELYTADDRLIGIGYEYLDMYYPPMSLVGINQAYSDFKKDFFKVPSGVFDAQLSVTEQVYSIEITASKWGSAESVIDTVYGPTNSVSIDLARYDSSVGGNYSIELNSFAEDGTPLDYEYFNVLVYDPGVMLSTTSEYPVYRSGIHTFSWATKAGEPDVQSYEYGLYGTTVDKNQPNLDVISVGTTDSTSLSIDLSQVVDGGQAYLYITAKDALGAELGKMFYLIRIDNSRPNIDLDDPSAGSVVHAEDLYLELDVDDRTHTNVTINGMAISPDYEYESYYSYEYELYEYLLSLPEGEQFIEIRAVDEAGNEAYLKRKIFIDSNPPTINVDENIPLITTEANYTLSGTVSDAVSLAAVAINGNLVFADTRGEILGKEKEVPFTYTIPMSLGTNYIQVQASDKNMNSAHAEFWIDRAIEISQSVLSEASANDGGISDTLTLALPEGYTFASNVSTGITAYHLPEGLTVSATRIDDRHVRIAFAGKATHHANSNDTDHVMIAVDQSKINGAVSEVISLPFKIDFNDPASASAGGGFVGGFFPNTDIEKSDTGVVVKPTPRTETTPDGKKMTVADVDDNSIKQALEQMKGNSGSQVITVDIGKTEGSAKASLSGNAMLAASKAAPNAVIAIKSDQATYNLPVSALDINGIAASLGAKAGDVKVNVTMEKVTGDTAAQISAKAQQSGMTLVGEPIDFNVTVEANGKSQQITDFGSTYVTRTVVLTESVNGTQASVVLYDPETGEITFVPATFSIGADGTTQVTIKRNGNSIYTVVKNGKSFADIKGHWAQKDIELLASKALIRGMTEQQFAPDAKITRAQFAAILAQALGLSKDKASANFSDVKPNDWFAGYVGAASKSGLIAGYSDGSFRPNDVVTREQMAVMIANAIRFAGKTKKIDGTADELLSKFSDKGKISGWAKEAIAQAVDLGIMGGIRSDAFVPADHATRAQAAVVVKKLLAYLGFINN